MLYLIIVLVCQTSREGLEITCNREKDPNIGTGRSRAFEWLCTIGQK